MSHPKVRKFKQYPVPISLAEKVIEWMQKHPEYCYENDMHNFPAFVRKAVTEVIAKAMLKKMQ